MTSQRTWSFERRLDVEAGFDRRHADPSKNYGIHGAELVFLLIGIPQFETPAIPRAIQVKFGTDWYPRSVRTPEWQIQQRNRDLQWIAQYGEPLTQSPNGYDVGYHSPHPMYEGQEALTDSCDILGGAPCYYDGSGLRAAPLAAVLVEQGSEAIWRFMEQEFARRFNDLDEEALALHASWRAGTLPLKVVDLEDSLARRREQATERGTSAS